MTHEQFEQIELFGGQFDLASTASDFARAGIQHQIGELQRLADFAAGLGAAQ